MVLYLHTVCIYSLSAFGMYLNMLLISLIFSFERVTFVLSGETFGSSYGTDSLHSCLGWLVFVEGKSLWRAWWNLFYTALLGGLTDCMQNVWLALGYIPEHYVFGCCFVVHNLCLLKLNHFQRVLFLHSKQKAHKPNGLYTSDTLSFFNLRM